MMPAATNTEPAVGRATLFTLSRGLRRLTRFATLHRPTIRAALFNVVVVHRGHYRAAGALHQVSLDQRVDIAVEYPVDVADLILGPVILDELIGVQHVAADLAAERDLALL